MDARKEASTDARGNRVAGVPVVGLGVVAFVNFFGDSMCPSRLRDSDAGKLSWSVLPPGHRCVWTKAMNGYDATEGPGWEASAYLVFMVVSGVAIVRVFRTSEQDQP
jgi:hypothetical protein